MAMQQSRDGVRQLEARLKVDDYAALIGSRLRASYSFWYQGAGGCCSLLHVPVPSEHMLKVKGYGEALLMESCRDFFGSIVDGVMP
eukprot:1159754-Pelagomonas_calceolata.AAC.4